MLFFLRPLYWSVLRAGIDTARIAGKKKKRKQRKGKVEINEPPPSIGEMLGEAIFARRRQREEADELFLMAMLDGIL